MAKPPRLHRANPSLSAMFFDRRRPGDSNRSRRRFPVVAGVA